MFTYSHLWWVQENWIHAESGIIDLDGCRATNIWGRSHPGTRNKRRMNCEAQSFTPIFPRKYIKCVPRWSELAFLYSCGVTLIIGSSDKLFKSSLIIRLRQTESTSHLVGLSLEWKWMWCKTSKRGASADVCALTWGSFLSGIWFTE